MVTASLSLASGTAIIYHLLTHHTHILLCFYLMRVLPHKGALMRPRLIHKILGNPLPQPDNSPDFQHKVFVVFMAAQIINCFNASFRLFQRLKMSALELEMSSSHPSFCRWEASGKVACLQSHSTEGESRQERPSSRFVGSPLCHEATLPWENTINQRRIHLGQQTKHFFGQELSSGVGSRG